VNPGTIILGYGNDADITPKLKAFLNVNYIWMAETETIRQVLMTNHTSNEVGLDCSLGDSISAAADEQHHLHSRHGITWCPGKDTRTFTAQIRTRFSVIRGRVRGRWMIFSIQEF